MPHLNPTPRVSTLICDPALREIFRRAEGDDGCLAEIDRPLPVISGAAVRVLETVG